MRDSTGRCSFWKQRGSVERLYTADRDNNEPTGSSDGPSVQLSTDGRKLPSRIRTESSGSDSSSTEEIVDMEEGSDGSLCGRRLSRSEERPSAMEDMDSYVSFRMARIKFDTSSEVIPPSEGASRSTDDEDDTEPKDMAANSSVTTNESVGSGNKMFCTPMTFYSNRRHGFKNPASDREPDSSSDLCGKFATVRTDEYAPSNAEDVEMKNEIVSKAEKGELSNKEKHLSPTKEKPVSDDCRGPDQKTPKTGHSKQNKAATRAPAGHEHGDNGQKSKITKLFVKFAETVNENINITGFLLQRLPGGMNAQFTLTDRTIDQRTGNTVFSLQCPSRRAAQRLEAELNRSNTKSKTTVHCFYSFEEACDLTMMTKQKTDILLDGFVKEMVKRAESALKKHQTKIQEVEGKLQSLNKPKSKFLSLENFHTADLERRALQNKVEELLLHKTEFCKFIATAHEKFSGMRDMASCEMPAQHIMRAFGIECNRLAKALPMYAKRTDILDIVHNNQVSIIIGETGSGKSTQMAQYLYQTGLANDGLIVCTQPRKVAAISVATYVASEMATSVGQVIGYKVGMQEKRTAITKVMFMTDYVLLKECLKDRNLSSFSCIIIDEAHERSIYTDLLLGMIKSCLQVRKDLHVVITSATINPDVFVEYFGQCPVLSVSGRMFPVEIIWKDPDSGHESFNNYIEECVRTAVEVHGKQPLEGDILVFVTSPQETEKCCEKFTNYTEGRPNDFVCLQLHGKLQANEQSKVFDPLPPGRRKIVFATNSAETSITIPGIRYVIDTGLVKEMNYDAKRKINTLAVTTVSQSSADQRKGRAGRTGPGTCYRLYKEEEYENMKSSMVPEMLRVNLGQAMLKLMELDIDPLEFDFVMSPSPDSMESAVEALEDLGTVSKKKITDLGKWVSKLPLDPKCGVFIHNALEIGAGIEGMVIAAATSGGPVFFRAGTVDEKELADRKKIPFCHVDGDLLTMLNVFRKWSKESEKAKGKWCVKHSINGKTMKGIRDTVNEVLTTLRKEMKTTVPFTFGDPTQVDPLLIKPLLKTFRGNVSHYLGHPKAGYVLIMKDQRVEVHPSSALVSLASQPEWIVFDQVMRTSKDFAMNITIVNEEMVKQGIEDGILNVDFEEARNKRLLPILQECVGSQLLREVVGPRYTALRSLETELVEKCNGNIVVIEADRDNGEIKVFSKSSNQKALEGSLENVLKPLKAQFLSEEREQKLGKKPADRSVRAVVCSGGRTENLFMPDEFKVVMIHCAVNKKEDMEDEDVFHHFSKFGKIQACKKYFHKKNAPSLWGQVTFYKTQDAVEAVKETRENPDLSARPNIRMSAERSDKFRAKIQWCRRSSRGFGFVTFASLLDADQSVRQARILVGDSFANIRRSRSNLPNQNAEYQVHVAGLSKMVNEDVLRESFANIFDLDPNTDITKVAVIREKVPMTSGEMLNTMKRRLSAEIETYIPNGSYELDLKTPARETDVNFTAFVTFDSPEDGEGVCHQMDHRFVLNGQIVAAKPILHCSFYILKDVYEKSSDDVNQCIADLEGDGVRVKAKTLRNENVVVDINTDDVESLVLARRYFQNIIKGDVMECAYSPPLKAMFTWEGRNKIKQIMNRTDTLIMLDNRVMTVSLHGMQRNREKAKQKIDEFLQELSTGNSEWIDLKGDGKPPGVLKAILVKYKIDFSGLCQETGLVAVRLDYRNHRLMLIGSEDAVQKAKATINGIIENLSPEGLRKPDEPECVTCFCPVEQKELYRVECCGHPYCKECLQVQLQTSITDKEFPLQCEMEECSTPFVWKDFINLSKLGFIKVSELTDASVNQFVLQNKKTFRYCVTPDCPIVYRVSASGRSFICPECDVKLCTRCHVQFHDGISCAMFQVDSTEDVSIRQWLAKNKANRKRCPNCAMPIEKNGGCNHLNCLSCKKHICWLCLTYYDDSRECYGHLEKMHGSFG